MLMSCSVCNYADKMVLVLNFVLAQWLDNNGLKMAMKTTIKVMPMVIMMMVMPIIITMMMKAKIMMMM